MSGEMRKMNDIEEKLSSVIGWLEFAGCKCIEKCAFQITPPGATGANLNGILGIASLILHEEKV